MVNVRLVFVTTVENLLFENSESVDVIESIVPNDNDGVEI